MSKKFSSIMLALLLFISCPFLLTACKKKKSKTNTPPPPAVTIESIEVLGEIDTTYFVGDELDIDGIQIKIIMSDETSSTITLTNEMISGFDTSTAGEKSITITYKGETTEVPYTVVEPAVTGITLKSPITKTEYFVGDTLNLAGGKIEVSYENETTKEFDLTAEGVVISGFDSETAGQQKTLTITYKEKTVTLKYNVTAIVTTKIELNSDITKKDYFEGEQTQLDVTGGKIKVFYNDSRKDEIINITPAMVSGFNPVLPNGFADASKPLTLTITHNGKTTTTTCNIIKVVETKIELSSPITKTEYFETETFNPAGGKVTIFYNDSSRNKTINLTTEMTNFNNEIGNDKVLTITYTGVTTKTTTTTYDVKDVYATSLEILEETPIKTEYWEGDYLDISGVQFKVFFNFGEPQIVNLQRSMVEIGNDYFEIPTPVGNPKKFTINYLETSLDIYYIVKQVLIESISLYKDFDNMIYYPHDMFDPTGGQLLLTYNNGDTDVVDIYPNTVSLSPVKSSETGAFEVTIKTNYENLNENPSDPLDNFLTTTISNVIVNHKRTTIKTQIKTDYFIGEELDTTGGQLQIEYFDGFDASSNVISEKTEVIDIVPSMITEFSTETVGYKTGTISYMGWTNGFNYDVKALITTAKLTSTFKTDYYDGDELDLTGGQITITYSDGRPNDVISLQEAVDSGDAIITGFSTEPYIPRSRTLNITYKGTTVYLDTVSDIPYIVYELLISSIAVISPFKTEYYINEELDLTGGKVRVTYNNSTYEDLDITVDMFDTTGQYEFNTRFANIGDPFKLRLIIDGVRSEDIFYTVSQRPVE